MWTDDGGLAECYFIAELGHNHQGDLASFRSSSGVKGGFQWFETEVVYVSQTKTPAQAGVSSFVESNDQRSLRGPASTRIAGTLAGCEDAGHDHARPPVALASLPRASPRIPRGVARDVRFELEAGEHVRRGCLA